MEARDRIQNMLCEKVENLESVIRSCAKLIDSLHTNVNLIQNSRGDKDRCESVADDARARIREVVAALHAAAPEATP